jgi:chemotaxis protein MotB
MKAFKILIAFIILSAFSSCVTSKKFNSLNSAYKKSADADKNCEEALRSAQAEKDQLSSRATNLQAQVDDLKKQLDHATQNTAQVLTTLQDLSVMSGKQAESVKQSLETLGEKDSYIHGLQSAMARKDSLNMELVMNLKGALNDINDKDINIKVEKGVVYIDISDKLLFNSGKYNVTEAAKKVLGKVAKVLNAYPDMDFMVEGHTDNVPIHTDCMQDNWDLSAKRATSVIRILQTQYNIRPERMSAAGRSEYVPLASNNDKEGRALNRRTRIIILPQLDQFFKLLVKKQ